MVQAHIGWGRMVQAHIGQWRVVLTHIVRVCVSFSRSADQVVLCVCRLL